MRWMLVLLGVGIFVAMALFLLGRGGEDTSDTDGLAARGRAAYDPGPLREERASAKDAANEAVDRRARETAAGRPVDGGTSSTVETLLGLALFAQALRVTRSGRALSVLSLFIALAACSHVVLIAESPVACGCFGELAVATRARKLIVGGALLALSALVLLEDGRPAGWGAIRA